jgi:hypothetical protein
MKPTPPATAETFVGEPIKPHEALFSASAMATGKPAAPQSFVWREQTYLLQQVLTEWKEAGNCSHGPGERYVRKHWFRVRVVEDLSQDGAADQIAEPLEMRIYFERQRRSSGSRWWLYSTRPAAAHGSSPPCSPR